MPTTKKSFVEEVDSSFVKDVEDVRTGKKLVMVNSKIGELQKTITDNSISLKALVTADGMKNFEAIASCADEISYAAKEAAPILEYRRKLAGK